MANKCCCRYWHNLGLDFPCPIAFKEDEIRTHPEQGEKWNEEQDFWDGVAPIVDVTGWTLNRQYADGFFFFFSQSQKRKLKSLKGNVREEF